MSSLLKDNPEWETAERRHDMKPLHGAADGFAFSPNADIFQGIGLFTQTVERMSAKDSSNTHEVIDEIFRAMNTKREDRAKAELHAGPTPFPM